MSLEQLSKLSILKDRALMFQKARSFFSERDIIEVDCPALSVKASIDAHIDLIETNDRQFLHSSPEYGMKRLLAQGMGDIYQLSHVFRDSEQSDKHNPEFTMAEWYRIGFTFEQMIKETCEFIRLFLGDLPYETLSYKEAIKTFSDIDYTKATPQEITETLEMTPHTQDKDALLNILLGTKVEPQLGKNKLTVMTHFPATQAALAKITNQDGENISLRFEVYYNGIELANGYDELTDPKEQKSRLLEQNKKRIALGKQKLPLDDKFLEALKQGLPDSCGVAVGFDRLMMLRHKILNIEDVIPFR